MLERFRDIVGGKLNGPYKRGNGKHKDIWHWRLDAQGDVRAFLELVRPDLCGRRAAKADEALDIIRTWHAEKGAVRLAAVEKMLAARRAA